MSCPKCAQKMEDGWLAVFNPIPWLNFVAWQGTKPGYVRVVRPAGSENVIVPRSGGRGCPKLNSVAAARRWSSLTPTSNLIESTTGRFGSPSGRGHSCPVGSALGSTRWRVKG